MSNKMHVFCESGEVSIYNVRELNSSFAVASLAIMYTGSNPNGSDFSKESVEDALPTLYNVPIVCNWDPENREIGGHDVEFVSDENGNVKMRNLTVPCGVVTDHTEFTFEVRPDKYGVEHEYLIASNVILWKRQDVYDYIVNDLGGKIDHSMEIEVFDGEKDNNTGLYHINKFEFTALCLLGNVKPCFDGSRLQVYSDQGLKQRFSQMMEELKECYQSISPAINAVDNTNNESIQSSKGGDIMSEDITVLAKEFGIDLDTIDFSLEGMAIEDVRAKFEEMTANTAETATNDTADPETPDVGSTTDGDGENFNLTSNIADELRHALESETVHYEWGDCQRYWMRDFDVESGELYVEDMTDWKLYGVKYTMNGDSVVIDWNSKSRKKYAIVDFEDGDSDDSAAYANVFDQMKSSIESAQAEVTSVTEKYDAATAEMESLKAEVSELKEYKSKNEAAIAANVVDSVLEQFSYLDGIEAFEALKASAKEDSTKYDKDTLEEKCYAIKGRYATVEKFSASNQNSTKIHVSKETESDVVNKPYGGVVEQLLGE